MSGTNKSQRPELTPGQAGEILVRVRAASQGDASPGEVAELRGELEPSIDSCNRWLSMLREWVRRGLLVEAASVNDSYPDLCQVAHVLAMPEDRLAWDQACNRAGVAPNSRIDEAAYLELSDAIADACSLGEFVERFQVAVLGRRPLSARIRALKGLLAAAPRNDAVRALAKRFESEALASLEQDCRQSAAEGRPTDLADALDAIEGLGWESHFSDEFVGWLRAEIDRRNRIEADAKYDLLAPRIEAAFAARDLALVGSLAEECDQVEREHGVEPGAGFRGRTREALGWADGERARLRAGAEHAEQCEAMRRALDQGYSYTELEPIHGRILRFGLGVPADIESRFSTVHAAWKSARRRRTAAVVGLAALGVACAAGAIAFLAWQRSELQRAENTAARLVGIVEAGGYEEARRLLEEVRQSEPWMLEVPAIGSVDSRVRQEGPQYDAARAAIRDLLKRAEDTGPDDADSLGRRTAELNAALSPTQPLQRPTAVEAEAIRAARDRLQLSIERIAERERLKRESDFADLRRAFAQLPSSSDRPAQERLSIASTEQYLQAVQSLDGRVRSHLVAMPAQDPARAEADSMLDRLSKDAQAARDLLPRLRQAEQLLSRIRIRPESESDYLALLQTLADEYPDIAAATDGNGGAAIAEARKMARAAVALEDWRDRVLVAIGARNDDDGIAIPAQRGKAAEIGAVLQSHVDTHPYSPHAQVARAWKSLCDRAAAGALDSPMQGALMALSDAGLLRLEQVAVKGGRWAFVRDDVQVANAASGMVRSLPDLTCPPGQLGVDLEIAQQLAGRRVPTPWGRAVEDARERLGAADLASARMHWLRLMAAVRGSREQTDEIARSIVLMSMWDAYVRHLAVDQGPDQQLAKDFARLRKGEASFLACDWPRLALRPASDGERKRQQESALALRNAMPDFEREADGRGREFDEQRVAARPARLVGVLLPREEGQARRRCAPPDLPADDYEVLAWDPPSQAWILRPMRIENGELAAEAPGVPRYSLMYQRK